MIDFSGPSSPPALAVDSCNLADATKPGRQSAFESGCSLVQLVQSLKLERTALLLHLHRSILGKLLPHVRNEAALARDDVHLSVDGRTTADANHE
jgi:hypothetical protein